MKNLLGGLAQLLAFSRFARVSKHQKQPKGHKHRRVKSALTGAMIPATKTGYPCARRPLNYDHGPSEKALARRLKRKQMGQ